MRPVVSLTSHITEELEFNLYADFSLTEEIDQEDLSKGTPGYIDRLELRYANDNLYGALQLLGAMLDDPACSAILMTSKFLKNEFIKAYKRIIKEHNIKWVINNDYRKLRMQCFNFT